MLVTNRIGEFTKHLNFLSGCHIVLMDWSLCLSHSHTLTLSLRPAIFLPPRNRRGQAHSSRPSNGSQANTTSYIISYRRGQAHLSRPIEMVARPTPPAISYEPWSLWDSATRFLYFLASRLNKYSFNIFYFSEFLLVKLNYTGFQVVPHFT